MLLPCRCLCGGEGCLLMTNVSCSLHHMKRTMHLISKISMTKIALGEKVEEVDNETRPSVSRRLGDSLSSLISHQA